MVTRDEYLAKTKGYKRPAINFNKRDDIREFAGSGHGQNYNRMMDIQRQLPNMDRNDPVVQEFKDKRRTFNRYGKNPMGEVFGKSPLEMQDKYVDLSRDVRQTNKPVYNKMYPITGGFMDYTQGGGMFGLAAKALKGILGDSSKMGSDILQGVGIGGAVPREEATEKVLTNYANKTFGTPNIHEDEFIDTENWYDDRKDVVIPPDYPIDEGDFTSLSPFDDSRREAAIMNQYPGKGIMERPFGTPDVHADEPWPHEDTEVIEEKTQDGNLISDELWESIKEFDPGTIGGGGDLHAGEDITVAPWLTDPSLPMPPELTEGEYLPGEYHDELIGGPPPIPFDDSFRESGIARLMMDRGKRPYEDVYREFVESSGPSKVMVTYEDFMENYLPRIQESRGVFRAGLNSQGRR